MDCLFCKITEGEIPSTKVYEDEHVYAFNDIAPQAPIHIIIIPKDHIASTNEIGVNNCEIIGYIYAAAAKIAKELKISEDGYRIVNNCGRDGGQTVDHIHFHMLGGRSLGWPPG